MLKRLLARLRADRGFGLIELLVSLTMMQVGIFALMAVFNSSTIAVRRASRISTASVLADKQMELYRALTYSAIALDSASVTAADTTYKCDTALGGSCATTTDITTTCTGSPLPAQCLPTQSVTGPDHGTYRIDTYVVSSTPTNGRALKLVTIVVRDTSQTSVPTLARESSTFDQSLG